LRPFILALFLVACGKPATDTTDTDAADTDVGDTDVEDTSPPCVTLVDGAWYGAGSAFGMRMGVTLTMDVDQCSFTLTDWSMDMGPIADAGTIDGDEVTLSGPNDYWATCVGTAAEDGESVDGACSADGAAFNLKLR
jgi:hypothetical protein